MNTSAEQHLAKARDYVARGEEFYHQAAKEIIAARKLGATWVECGDRLDRSDEWVKKVVAWHKTPANDNKSTVLPFAEPQGAVAKRHAKSVLREAPAEQIAEMLADPDVRRKVHEAQDIAHAKVERDSRKAERQAIGADADDELREQGRLRRAEAKQFEARRALIETLRILNEIGAEQIPDSWREEFIRTFDDLEGKAQLGRALLTGALDEELDKLLAGEA